jgi:hypothetical protein
MSLTASAAEYLLDRWTATIQADIIHAHGAIALEVKIATATTTKHSLTLLGVG